jgi:hypothetical protein
VSPLAPSAHHTFDPPEYLFGSLGTDLPRWLDLPGKEVGIVGTPLSVGGTCESARQPINSRVPMPPNL